MFHLGSGQLFSKDPYSNSQLSVPLPSRISSGLPAVCMSASTANAAFSIAVRFHQPVPWGIQHPHRVGRFSIMCSRICSLLLYVPNEFFSCRTKDWVGLNVIRLLAYELNWQTLVNLDLSVDFNCPWAHVHHWIHTSAADVDSLKVHSACFAS